MTRRWLIVLLMGLALPGLEVGCSSAEATNEPIVVGGKDPGGKAAPAKKTRISRLPKG